MDDADDKDEVLNLSLNPRAKKIIRAIRSETGVPKVEALARILEFFAEFPLELRLAVLNRNPQVRDHLLRDYIRNVVAIDGFEGPGRFHGTFEDAVRAARAILDEVERLGAARSGAGAGGRKDQKIDDRQPRGASGRQK